MVSLSMESEVKREPNPLNICNFEHKHLGQVKFKGCGKYFCSDHGHFPALGLQNENKLGKIDKLTLNIAKSQSKLSADLQS